MPTINGPSPLTDNQINNQAFSTQTLVGFIFRSRASLLHDQVTSLATEITNTTNNIKELSEALACAKRLEAAKITADDSNPALHPANHGWNYYMEKYNFILRNDSHEYWPANETILQGLIDQQTNIASQLSTTLQNLTNKYNNAFDVVKSFIEYIKNAASDILSKVG